jgi:hypothetical protein
MMDELIDMLMTRYGFSRAAIDICVKGRFCCEYCGRDILELFERFRFSHTDHLLPQSKYESLKYVTSNHVLSCQTCNMLKRNWDPNLNDDGSTLVADGAVALTDGERSELIARAKRYVEQVRQAKVEEFNQYRALLRRLGPSESGLP